MTTSNIVIEKPTKKSQLGNLKYLLFSLFQRHKNIVRQYL